MKVYLGGEAVELEADFPASTLEDRLIVRTAEGSFSGLAVVGGGKIFASFRGRTFEFDRFPAPKKSSLVGSGEIRSPMPGLVISVLISPGESVVQGQKMIIIEAMKTQQPILAPFDGIAKEVKVAINQQIGQGDLLAIIESVDKD